MSLPETYVGVRRAMFKAAGSGTVLHHEPTERNKLGQSGIHTVCDDIIDIVLEAQNERDAYGARYKYFAGGGRREMKAARPSADGRGEGLLVRPAAGGPS